MIRSRGTIIRGRFKRPVVFRSQRETRIGFCSWVSDPSRYRSSRSSRRSWTASGSRVEGVACDQADRAASRVKVRVCVISMVARRSRRRSVRLDTHIIEDARPICVDRSDPHAFISEKRPLLNNFIVLESTFPGCNTSRFHVGERLLTARLDISAPRPEAFDQADRVLADCIE